MITILDLKTTEDNIDTTVKSLIKVEQKREYLRSTLNEFLSLYKNYNTPSPELDKVKDIFNCLNEYNLSTQHHLLTSFTDELNNRIFQNTSNKDIVRYLRESSACLTDSVEKSEQLSSMYLKFRRFLETDENQPITKPHVLRTLEIFIYSVIVYKCDCKQNLDDIRTLIKYFSRPTESPPHL